MIATLVTILLRYLNRLGDEKKLKSKNNILLDDSPISKSDSDKLDYEETVKNLTDILYSDNHKKSFTIGLVGPWGNGKSSVLKMVEKELKKKNQKDDNQFITFNFLPYLNHKENDIINEFFTCLSNELKPYSGKLSNLITEYSSKLTDLYENKNVLGFIENHVTDFKNSSANELYSLINQMLSDVNKKIIVFVDDLDRLNKDEILQVFKLIRNTADFRNTLFVVAMDKEYVLKSLKKSKKIFHSSFIDKFFQLEIYLPEIDKNKLKEIFIDELLKSNLNDGSPMFELKIKEAVNNRDNLFEDYIKNIRDIKRTVNQIVYDFPSTSDEVNLKDLINFTYFKLKFPNFVKIIKQGIGNFIEVDSKGLYNLKIKDPKDTEPKNFKNNNLSRYLTSKQVFNPEKYKLFNNKLFENCLIEDNTLDCENKILLIKTLAFLFGDENHINNVDSIKYENNLRILLEQKVYKNRLLKTEFNLLLNTESNTISKIIDSFHQEKKLEQLMSRFQYFSASTNPNEYKNAILALVFILENHFEFNVHDATINNQIGIFANKLTKVNDGFNLDIKDWSLEKIFKNEAFKIDTRVNLFSQLKNAEFGNKYDFDYWGFKDSDEREKILLELYDEYLESKNNNLNDVNDYSFYHTYHNVKLGIEGKVINKFVDFWNHNDIEMLCAQMTEIDTWSSTTFKITNVVNEIYSSTKAFVEFIKQHEEANRIAIREFIYLYELLEISNFRYPLIFSFEKSQLMKDKIERQKQYRTRDDENKNTIQLILETNSNSIIDVLRKENMLKNKYSVRIESKENENFTLHYIFVFLKKSIGKDPVLTFIQDFYQSILPLTPDWQINGFDENNIKKNYNLFPQLNNFIYINIKSIEPKDNNQFNYETY
ncbi:P-loop NTPase fold protein [Flavobacterium sp.]|uniref:KAP family P-loop NTPase fold protein n=1 Tax=Flavobacterium sp. TaxID=239 RepID=UPI0026212C7B|nr:P-loop NTPase fold protein [Flavobacterium sp.]